jgi:osmotically-inducible protein OsmY
MMRVLGALALAALLGLAACARGPGPPLGAVGISLEDGRIAAAVRSALLSDRDLSLRDIAVEVHRGVVSLAGEVRTADEAERALTLVRAVRGVGEVKSTLKVVPGTLRSKR